MLALAGWEEKERERLTEGVPSPASSPQLWRHRLRDTKQAALSWAPHSILHSMHSPTHIHACPQTLALTPAQPCARLACNHHSLQRNVYAPALRKPLGLSLLRTETCSVTCEWCLDLCEAAERSAHGRKECSAAPLQSRTPRPKERADVTEEERGGERNKISPTPPSFIWENNTQPPVGEGQLLSLSPRSRSRAKSRQTRWHTDLLPWEEKTAQQQLLRFLRSFDSVLGQLLSDNHPVNVCVYECVDCSALVWRPRAADAATVFTPARPLWPLSIPGITGQQYRDPSAWREAALWEVLEGDFQGCGHPETRERHRGQHHRPQEGDQVSSLLSNHCQGINTFWNVRCPDALVRVVWSVCFFEQVTLCYLFKTSESGVCGSDC